MKQKNMLKKMIYASAFCISFQANAVDLKFSGTLVIPNCVVNNNTDISIVFPSMEIQRVSTIASPGTNAVTQAITLNCPYSVGTPYVLIGGTVMTGQAAPSNILATNQTALGIALYQGTGIDANKRLLLGAGSGVGYAATNGMTGTGSNRTFTLTAAPVTSDYTRLAAGNFTASASIAIIYQ
jgi:minor pilin subunit PapF